MNQGHFYFFPAWQLLSKVKLSIRN